MTRKKGDEEEEDDDIDGDLVDGFSSGPGSPVDKTPPPAESLARAEVSPVQESAQTTKDGASSPPSSPTIISSDEDMELAANGTEVKKKSSKSSK